MTDENSKEKIIAAAWQVFVDKGYDGARMQEIADLAGINKAMIYYYYKSKDELFEGIISDTFQRFFTGFFEMMDLKSTGVTEFIPAFVDAHIDFLAQNPNLPKLLVREIHGSNPAIQRVLHHFFSELISELSTKILIKIEEAGKRGEIRSVDPMQTIFNVLGLNIMFFTMRPVIDVFMEKFPITETELLTRRKEAIKDLLLYGLLPR